MSSSGPRRNEHINIVANGGNAVGDKDEFKYGGHDDINANYDGGRAPQHQPGDYNDYGEDTGATNEQIGSDYTVWDFEDFLDFVQPDKLSRADHRKIDATIDDYGRQITATGRGPDRIEDLKASISVIRAQLKDYDRFIGELRNNFIMLCGFNWVKMKDYLFDLELLERKLTTIRTARQAYKERNLRSKEAAIDQLAAAKLREAQQFYNARMASKRNSGRHDYAPAPVNAQVRPAASPQVQPAASPQVQPASSPHGSSRSEGGGGQGGGGSSPGVQRGVTARRERRRVKRSSPTYQRAATRSDPGDVQYEDDEEEEVTPPPPPPLTPKKPLKKKKKKPVMEEVVSDEEEEATDPDADLVDSDDDSDMQNVVSGLAKMRQ